MEESQEHPKAVFILVGHTGVVLQEPSDLKIQSTSTASCTSTSPLAQTAVHALGTIIPKDTANATRKASYLCGDRVFLNFSVRAVVTLVRLLSCSTRGCFTTPTSRGYRFLSSSSPGTCPRVLSHRGFSILTAGRFHARTLHQWFQVPVMKQQWHGHDRYRWSIRRNTGTWTIPVRIQFSIVYRSKYRGARHNTLRSAHGSRRPLLPLLLPCSQRRSRLELLLLLVVLLIPALSLIHI